eukprot:3784882-Amphidinium_carterae.1
MGFDLSWAKGGWGRSMTWIGAHYKVVVDGHGFPAVEMSLAEIKYAEMRSAVKSLLTMSGMVDVAVVRKLAGQLSWASGMFKWLRSFNRHLWAALASHDLQAVRRHGQRRPVWLFP